MKNEKKKMKRNGGNVEIDFQSYSFLRFAVQISTCVERMMIMNGMISVNTLNLYLGKQIQEPKNLIVH